MNIWKYTKTNSFVFQAHKGRKAVKNYLKRLADPKNRRSIQTVDKERNKPGLLEIQSVDLRPIVTKPV